LSTTTIARGVPQRIRHALGVDRPIHDAASAREPRHLHGHAAKEARISGWDGGVERVPIALPTIGSTSGVSSREPAAEVAPRVRIRAQAATRRLDVGSRSRPSRRSRRAGWRRPIHRRGFVGIDAIHRLEREPGRALRRSGRGQTHLKPESAKRSWR
jgi:hypothetical protein